MMFGRFMASIERLFRAEAEKTEAVIGRLEKETGELKRRLDAELDALRESEIRIGKAQSKNFRKHSEEVMSILEEVRESLRSGDAAEPTEEPAPLAGLSAGVPRFFESNHLKEAEALFAEVKNNWLRGTLVRMHARMRFAEMTNDVGLLCVLAIQQLEAYAHLTLRELYLQDGKWIRDVALPWYNSAGNKSEKIQYRKEQDVEIVPQTEFVVNVDGWYFVQLLDDPVEGVEFRRPERLHDDIYHHSCKVRMGHEDLSIYITSPVKQLSEGLRKGQWLRVRTIKETPPEDAVEWTIHFGNRPDLFEMTTGDGPWRTAIRVQGSAFDLFSWEPNEVNKWTGGILGGRFQWSPTLKSGKPVGTEVKFMGSGRRRLRPFYQGLSNSGKGEVPEYYNMHKDFKRKVRWMMEASTDEQWGEASDRFKLLLSVYHERNRFVHSNLAHQWASTPACSAGEVADFWDEEILPCIKGWIPHINAWSDRQSDSTKPPSP